MRKRWLEIMKTSTQDKVEGAVKTATGTIKEKTGQALNDPDLRDRGTLEKAEGQIQRKVGDIKKVFNH